MLLYGLPHSKLDFSALGAPASKGGQRGLGSLLSKRGRTDFDIKVVYRLTKGSLVHFERPLQGFLLE